MNKIHFLGLLFPLALLSACGDGAQPEQPGKVYEITGFSASTEGEDASKTYLSHQTEGGTARKPVVLWNAADKVTLVSSDGTSADFQVKSGAATTAATFEGYLASSHAPFYAVYPHTFGAALSDGTLRFSLPKTQAGAISVNPNTMPAIACFTDPTAEDIVFKNFCSMLRVCMPSGETLISKIELYDLGGAMLWGDVFLTNPSASNPDTWSYTLSGGDNCLVLNFATPRKLDNNYYYFVVPPGTLSKGIRLIVYDGSGNPIDEFCAGGDMSAARSHIKPMPNISIGSYVLMDVAGTNVGNWANCYIADYSNTTVTYKFCAMAGNSGALVHAHSAELLWETWNDNSAVTVNSVVKNVGLSAGCVTFQAGGRAGNAGIAVKNSSNNITWSWHIWLPATTPATVTVGSTSTDWMDRNLGATTASNNDGSMGFLYQWGRKDPFTGPYTNLGFTTALMKTSPVDAITSVMMYDPDKKHSTATMDWSIKNPTVIVDIEQGGSWDNSYTANWGGDTKTMYDPCPAGWRVAAVADFDGLTKKSLADWDITHHWFNEQPNFKIGGTGRRYYATGSSSHIVESSQTARYWARDFRGATANQAFEYTGGGSDDAPTAFQQAQTNKYICMGIRCVKE